MVEKVPISYQIAIVVGFGYKRVLNGFNPLHLDGYPPRKRFKSGILSVYETVGR